MSTKIKQVAVDAMQFQASMTIEVTVTREKQSRLRVWLFRRLVAFAVWVGGFGSAEVWIK